MANCADFDKYRKELTSFIASFVNPDFIAPFVDSEISRKGVIYFLNTCIPHADCTRTLDNGKRIIQTPQYRYKHLLCELLYAIDNYLDDTDKIDYISKLIEVHNKNLEFEKTNPPISYDVNKRGNSSSKTKATAKKEPKEKIPKKSVAERKLIAKITKLNALTFNLNVK